MQSCLTGGTYHDCERKVLIPNRIYFNAFLHYIYNSVELWCRAIDEKYLAPYRGNPVKFAQLLERVEAKKCTDKKAQHIILVNISTLV